MPSMRPFKAVSAHALKIAAIAILALPAIVSLTGGRKGGEENRAMATLPPLPRSAGAAIQAPAAFTAWVNDNFGYREGMIKLNNRVRFALFGEFPNNQLITGQHGRFFLAKHVAKSAPYLAIAHVCGNMASAEPDTVDYFNRMFAEFRAMGLDPHLLIVPSAPVVHSADLPPLLVANCARNDPPVTRVLASPQLDAGALSHIYFPLQELRAIKDRATLFPKTWFHWTGEGLDEVARLSLAHFWKMEQYPAPPLKTRSFRAKSDVAHLTPGVKLYSQLTEPDLEASGIKACFGAHCMPEMGDTGAVLGDITRFTNPAAPARRLVILSDSFGAKIAPWYARYYREVAQISTNNVGALGPQQIEAIKAKLLNDPAGTDLLFLFHDGSAVHNGLKLGVQRLHTPAPRPAA